MRERGGLEAGKGGKRADNKVMNLKLYQKEQKWFFPRNVQLISILKKTFRPLSALSPITFAWI